MFGLMQLLTGIAYGLPMPVQPLKAMAVIVITQKLTGNLLYGGGLAIGITMLIFSGTGLIDWIARAVPKSVIRGVQFGLGLQLGSLALKDYVQADGMGGYGLAIFAFAVTLALLGNRKCPPAIFVILLGFVYSLMFKLNIQTLLSGVGFHVPRIYMPTLNDVALGFVVLALPQLPLSLGNSILATRQIVEDLFPARSITVRKISLTYSLMNLINPFFGGIPTCHGSGGLAGHYAFGARTGGSVVLYGLLYLGLGLFLSAGFKEIIELFPKPILGVILMFEGLALMRLVRDMMASKSDLIIVFMVGLMANALPYGYVIGLVVGTLLARLAGRQLAGIGD